MRARESVVGATVASAGAIVAVGYTAPGQAGQQPVFLAANAAGRVRPVSLAGIPGGSIPELAVNGLAVAAGQQIAVGSAEGYPAVWRRSAGGSWALVTSLSQVSGGPGLAALTGVTHGRSGWLAVGAPGPVVMTSADGTSWRSATGPGSITAGLAGVAAVATAAGPHGYVIVGKLVASGGGCVADVWWSPDLKSWTRAHDVNDVTGSSQVLAVAAGAAGFVSVGSHDGQPAVWITANGTTWTTIVLPAPAGASSAVLQQVAISGNRVVAVGQATTPAGTVPIAELSLDGGISWRQVPISSPGAGHHVHRHHRGSRRVRRRRRVRRPRSAGHRGLDLRERDLVGTRRHQRGHRRPGGGQRQDQRARLVRRHGDRHRLDRHAVQPGGLHRFPAGPVIGVQTCP